MQAIFVYVTAGDEKEAQKIAQLLLKKKLIACANIFPIKSMYTWKGKVQSDDEVVLILKTLEKKYSLVETEIKKLHSYDVPCICKIPVSANKEYMVWVQEQLKK
ncbi:MAG TPA: divalent-cation tolerance protein CutA [Candidatus Nanoarchaeia archaeon]|nr:divalent-cation tolerance protein CutA [Candidatus Nanoarchaeia archaeon]